MGPAKGARQGRCAGFTLVEMMAAVVIFAVVMAAVYRAFALGLAARDRGRAVLEIQRDVEETLEQLAGDVRNMVPYAPVVFAGDEDELVFAVLLYGEGGASVGQVRYDMEEGVWRSAEVIGSGIERELQLLEPDWEVRFAYWAWVGEEYAWVGDTREAEGLPQALRVILKREGQALERTINLPLAR